jgi:hypothetical protein
MAVFKNGKEKSPGNLPELVLSSVIPRHTTPEFSNFEFPNS